MKQVANYQVSLKAILKNSYGEVLLLETLKGVHETYGKYDFPGGRIDTDEFETHYLDILAREVKEELGEKIKVDLSEKPVAIGRHKNTRDMIFYVVFEGIILSGDVEISDEHSSYEFLKLDEIILEDYFKAGMLEVVKMYLGK